jgi:hypothetical protein
MKELKLYLNYLEEKISSIDLPVSSNQIKHFSAFVTNVSEGIEYYKQLFSEAMGKIFDVKKRADYEITTLEEKLSDLIEDMVNKNLLADVSNFAAKVSVM